MVYGKNEHTASTSSSQPGEKGAHDPLCDVSPWDLRIPCSCAVIAETRAAAREAVEHLWTEQCGTWRVPSRCESCRTFDDVLRYALSGAGSEEAQ